MSNKPPARLQIAVAQDGWLSVSRPAANGTRLEVPAAFVVRHAGLRDLDALAMLETAAFPGDRLSRRSLRALTLRPTAILLVAEGQAGIMGYALVLVRRSSRRARLYSIAVAPAAAGRGIARSLLKAAEAEAGGRNCLFMRLEVREDNPAAIALYEKNGYRRFARRENYYHDGTPALRYERRLGGEDKGERP